MVGLKNLHIAEILRPVVYCVAVNHEGDANNRQNSAQDPRIDKLINSDP